MAEKTSHIRRLQYTTRMVIPGTEDMSLRRVLLDFSLESDG